MTPTRIQYNLRGALALTAFYGFSIPWTATMAWTTGDGAFLAMALALLALAARTVWLYVRCPR